MSHEEEGLTADELLGLLTGRCAHEVQLHRVMGVLGLAALQAGGKLELKLDGMKDLDGRGIAISIDERSGTGTATVATGTVDQPPAAGLSPTSWARVAHRQRRTGCLLQRSFGAAFFLALHNPALWPASVAGALPRRLVCDRQ